ncbi:MAG: serine/threonine protein kinase [Okeania sp. SIO3I5]|uniref:serine/threonine protein kinase n=1 Tax=Okeania sp. SIO3I5 TaxID=2607805 RepID=UPI0013B6A8FD|nr:serine/threonine-protein kinase [Okeania sp. SIO3I5]NEQ39076.1 serine/threonine protein kinase [Okeania sp. SIO3I5]
MTLHELNNIIAQRYRIVTALGKGGMGITYEAEDLTNYQRVAVKAVSLRQAKDWKILELFEREVKVIANLNYPQIPKYLNYFYIDTKSDRWFYLIRELVSVNSLATWVEKGWHATETQVKQVAIQILEILSYLHQLNPPIIHRDIKPENIILRPDGKIFLVDFGAVQDIYRQTISFSRTFVGTIGYMPPEQLRGKSYCASDLYSLGGTLLYLLTHRFADELPQKRMKIDFRSCVEISPEFADWLEVIL